MAGSEFAVPKERQQVTAHLSDGETYAGSIFLEFFPDARTLLQKITSFVENENDFFPLAAEGSAPHFISKASLNMLEVDYPDEEETFSIMHIEKVTIIFGDGSAVNGMLMADIPAEKARLSDCLNLPSRFLILRVDRSIRLINRARVKRVTYTASK